MIKTRSFGPVPARVMIVGEAPGEEEEKQGIPFVGRSGMLLTDILHQAGILRTDCFLTNVCKYRPSGNKIENFFEDKGLTQPNALIKEGIVELEKEIQDVKPNVIIACGNTPLWVLQDGRSAKAGITKWRGSELQLAPRLATRSTDHNHKAVVIPVYHPAAILRQWSWGNITQRDFRLRIKRYIDSPQINLPPYNFQLRPTYEQTIRFLDEQMDRLNSSPIHIPFAIDIETRHGHLACIGIAPDSLRAICIPLLCTERREGYWAPEEEVEIHWRLYQFLTHPQIAVIGQNFLYDAQYFAKHLGYVPRVRHDTMLMQHVALPSVPKGLDFLSSMYCSFHRYWKDEGKEWNSTLPEDQLWAYNCKDAVVTFEVWERLTEDIERFGLQSQYAFQMEFWHHILEVMLRGVLIDKKHRNELSSQLILAIQERESWRTFVCGHELNPASPKQMKAFFYDDLGQPKQWAKERDADGLRKPTLDDDAICTIARKEPLLLPLVRNIAETRSLGVFLRNFVQAGLDLDGCIRCYFNPGGTETYRLSSSKNAFGGGANLQTIPSGNEDADIDPKEIQQYNLPNVRKLFIPSSGYKIGEIDQAGADAQVVAWEAEDDDLKAAFRAGLKIHAYNCKNMFGSQGGPDGMREPYYKRTKIGVHATNYGAKARTISQHLGISVHEADRFQRRWFDIHPNILEWHKRIQGELSSKRTVWNKFGYRRIYFDRVEDLLPEALAWIPQSTVAIITNKAIVNTRPSFTNWTEQTVAGELLEESLCIHTRARLRLLGFQVLLQVHDSIVFQYPAHNEAEILPILHQATRIIVPYSDPLIIPWGLKLSNKSWGDAEKCEWPSGISLTG